MKAKRMHWRVLVFVGILVLACGLLCTVSFGFSNLQPAVDVDSYAAFLDTEVLDVEDLVEGAEIQRRLFNTITPPGVELFQPMMPPVAPFDEVNFSTRFLDALLGEAKNSVAVYPLALVLDSKTGDTLVLNAAGNVIATVESERKVRRAWPEGDDPSRVVLTLDLLPVEDVEPFLYVEQRVAESVGAMKRTGGGSGASPKSGTPDNELRISGITVLTNGAVQLSITNASEGVEVYAYTMWHESAEVTTVYTNEENVVLTNVSTAWNAISPSFHGMESAWTNLATNVVTTNGVGAFVDTDIPAEARVRFYAVSDSMDSDGDGLSNGEEMFLYRTEVLLADTDGDGILDGWEVQWGFDPNDPADAGTDLDGDGLTVLEECQYATNPYSRDTDGDGIPDGAELGLGMDPLDPDDAEEDWDADGISNGKEWMHSYNPLQADPPPVVRFRSPEHGVTYAGPATIILSSDWMAGFRVEGRVVYQIYSNAVTLLHEVEPGGLHEWAWEAMPGDYVLNVYGVDIAGRTGAVHSIEVTVEPSASFARLSASEQQLVLENGPRAVPECAILTHSSPVSTRTRGPGIHMAPPRPPVSSMAKIFANAQRFRTEEITPGHLNYSSMDYRKRDAMTAEYGNPNAPPAASAFTSTLYGTNRWGSRLKWIKGPSAVAMAQPIAYATMRVQDMNDRGDWVGIAFGSLRTVDDYSPYMRIRQGETYGCNMYREGVGQALTAPPPYNGNEEPRRYVFGINNDRLMVGTVCDIQSVAVYTNQWGIPSLNLVSLLQAHQPIIYHVGAVGTLLPVSPDAAGGVAYAVNNAGIIVGCETSTGSVANARAAKWVNGQVTPMGITGASQSVAYSISEDGAVVGLKIVDGQPKPFLTAGDGTDILLSSTINGIDFKEFWHIDEFGIIGWAGTGNNKKVYRIFPDDDWDGLSDWVEWKIINERLVPGAFALEDILPGADSDGDGLTNQRETILKTDAARRDSDGDRIPDGQDPFPMTHRDSDFDGLPNDWETFYGLNPNSAIGANGAQGDPDGDGVSNINEFRWGGNPMSALSPGYRFHANRINDLRVTIEDSVNCGGSSTNAQTKEATIQYVEMIGTNLALLEFTFDVTVKGKVERQDSGFDIVTVNGEYAFSGSNDGLECAMQEKTQKVRIKVAMPSGEITLRYATGDARYHAGAYARVENIELVSIKLGAYQFRTYPDDVPGPDHPHLLNLDTRQNEATHYSPYRKCVSHVWSAEPLDLAQYLVGYDDPAIRATFSSALQWRINNGPWRNSSMLNLGWKPRAATQFGIPCSVFEIEVRLQGGPASLDYLVVTVIPPETVTEFQTWHHEQRTDMDWLSALPAPYVSIVITNATAIDPEPSTCNPQRWQVPEADNTRMHPNAFFAMRSAPATNGSAHQATYTATGQWMRSGVSAGTADRVAAFPANLFFQKHFFADVKPFVMALQLDGNPCIRDGTTLNRPILHEGLFVKQYLSVRPPVANEKPPLYRGNCAPAE